MKDKIYVAQKERNRPVDITEIAISKVPRTRLYGFTDEQNAYIQERHKEILTCAKRMNRERGTKKSEVGILIDIHNWRYCKILGRKECGIIITDTQESKMMLSYAQKNQLMFLHNHPSTGTFSGQDLLTFCEQRTIFAMTVIGNDSSVYIMMKAPNFNEDLKSIYLVIARRYHENGIKNSGTQAVHYILKNADRYGIIYKKGRHKI